MAEGIRTGLGIDSLKKFGITMAACFAVIALIIMLKNRHNPLPACFISFAFITFTFIAPGLLSPVYMVWMKFAHILGWVNTRIILCVMFYLVFTPIGLLAKLFKADLLSLKIDKNCHSYWIKKENKGFSPRDYERQF